jgi:hypothetical protein
MLRYLTWCVLNTCPVRLPLSLQNPTEEEYISVVHAAEVNTWPAIPRIKAHCMVEMTLEQCVQRLRKRMTEESQREQLEALKQGGRATITRRDRTPSFYTSKSLVNLSGLSVADPAPIQQVWYHGNKNSREHLYQMAGGRSPRNSIHAGKL